MEKINTIIEMYERQIANLQWHLDTNGNMIDDTKKIIIQTQIRDRKDFIMYLKAI